MLTDILSVEKARLHDLETQVAELECGRAGCKDKTAIAAELCAVAAKFDEIDKLVSLESKARRDDFRRRAQHLKATYNHVRLTLDNVNKLSEQSNFEAQKEKLFAGASSQAYSDDISLEMAENGSLSRSTQKMNEYIAVGQETLAELVSQKERLKGIQRKVLDIMSHLGVSNSIMRAVERRDITDKYIVLAGMALVLLILLLVWWYR
jgi:golgi SNAP receptor complex member 2